MQNRNAVTTAQIADQFKRCARNIPLCQSAEGIALIVPDLQNDHTAGAHHRRVMLQYGAVKNQSVRPSVQRGDGLMPDLGGKSPHRFGAGTKVLRSPAKCGGNRLLFW